VSDQNPRFSFIQVGKPGGQQLHEGGLPEISGYRWIAVEH
jgi:hypothetical protein